MTLKQLVSAVGILMMSHVASANFEDVTLYDQKRIAITNVLLIDGTGKQALPEQTLLVEDGRFTRVGNTSEITLPEGVEVIDGQGKTVIPGLVMMHEHMFYPVGRRNYTEMLYSFPRLYLAGGATTVRTAGTMAPYADLNLRDAIADNKALGPDIDVTAPYLNGPGLPILKVKALTGVGDAKRTFKYWAEEGVTSYKAYMHIHQDELSEIIQLAHNKGQKVTGHLCSVTFREAAELGIDNLEHGFFAASDFVKDKEKDVCPSGNAVDKSLLNLDLDSPEVSSLIDFLVEKKVAITSTLTIFETFAKGRPKAREEALNMLIPQVRAQYESVWQKIADGDDETFAIIFDKARQMEKMFVDAGGTLIVGTDPTGYGGVIAGFSNKRAIELLVEAGFTIEQAVRFSTLNGASYLARDADIGSVEVGKRADFALIDGDLSSDPAAINKMPVVFKKGVGFDADKINASALETVGLH